MLKIHYHPTTVAYIAVAEPQVFNDEDRAQIAWHINHEVMPKIADGDSVTIWGTDEDDCNRVLLVGHASVGEFTDAQLAAELESDTGFHYVVVQKVGPVLP